MKVTTTPLTSEQLYYIWDNLRAADKQELIMYGITRQNIEILSLLSTETFCGLVDDVPVSVQGFTVLKDEIQFGFYATETANHFWKHISVNGRKYIRNVLANYPNHVGMCETWVHHKKAHEWLRVMGFVPKIVNGKPLILQKPTGGRFYKYIFTK